MSPSSPYNLDACDGYFVARETVLGTARALPKNLLVLASATHNAWASDAKDIGGNDPRGVLNSRRAILPRNRLFLGTCATPGALLWSVE